MEHDKPPPCSFCGGRKVLVDRRLTCSECGALTRNMPALGGLLRWMHANGVASVPLRVRVEVEPDEPN